LKKLIPILFTFLPLIFVSCANQLPPPGGEDDRIAPKILSVFPTPGTKNFKGREVTLRFDEYVDKRSFIESFSIYPEPPGETDISWSGKEVTIKFGGALSKDRTYVINLGRDLKDIRGGNALTTPAIFAFSTGNKIDSGKISGKLITDNLERSKILLYKIDSQREVNPEKQKAEYVVEPQDNGIFAFAFLPDGKYRIFGLYDDDRNSLYGKDIEKIAIPSGDIILSDGNYVSDVSLVLSELVNYPGSSAFLRALNPDSAEVIYSNIPFDGRKFDAGAKLYFYFRNNPASKQDVVSNFSLTDSVTGKTYKPVFNWLNDSLLEVFSAEKFDLNSKVIVRIDLRQTSSRHFFEKQFVITDKEATSVVSGRLTKKDESDNNVKLLLSSFGGTNGIFRTSGDEEGRFVFRNIPEGTYRLIVFDDENDNGLPDYGTFEPFRFSEKLNVYDKEIKVKSGWNVEDVVIEY
jgi:hypothetical protein